MKVLILHMRYAPDATGTGPLVTQLAEDLAREGDQVRVITTIPHYGQERIPERYRMGLVFSEERNGVQLQRTMAFPWASGKVWGRAWDYVLYTALASILSLFGPRPEAVLCVSPPITVGFAGWLVKMIRRVPLVFNAQDIWPDGLVQMGRLEPGWLVSLFHRFERCVYSVSDRVVVVSEGMKENLLQKGVPEPKVMAIPNWVDLDVIVPLKSEESFRERWGLGGKFIVLFAGNLGYAAGLGTVIETAALMQEEGGVHFLFVGRGSVGETLVQRCQRLGLDNVSFRPTQPEESLSRVLATADVSLVTLRSGMGQLSVPSKTFAYLASGRPIIAAVPANSEIQRILEDNHCGWVIPAEDPAALAAAIRDARELKAELWQMGNQGRQLVEGGYGRSSVIERIRGVLHELGSGHNGSARATAE